VKDTVLTVDVLNIANDEADDIDVEDKIETADNENN